MGIWQKAVWPVVAALASVSCGAARADDGEVSNFNWSGIYVGITGGYGWSDGRFVADDSGLLITSDHALDGALIGVYGGIQRQLPNNFVVGAEIDVSYRYGSDASGIHFNLYETLFDGQSYLAEMNWTGSARGRLGYSAGRWLPYVTAGIAWADYEVIHDNADPKTIFFEPKVSLQYDETSVGWTIGGGSEFALTDQIMIRAEYRYSDFGKGNVPLKNWTIDSEYELKSHDLTFGIGYQF